MDPLKRTYFFKTPVIFWTSIYVVGKYIIQSKVCGFYTTLLSHLEG